MTHTAENYGRRLIATFENTIEVEDAYPTGQIETPQRHPDAIRVRFSIATDDISSPALALIVSIPSAQRLPEGKTFPDISSDEDAVHAIYRQMQPCENGCAAPEVNLASLFGI